MSPKRITEDRPSQIARLQSLVEQADAEWDALTRSLQADQERLAALQQRLEHFRLALALQSEQPPSPNPALATQVAALSQQTAWLEQQITVKNARRGAVTQEFDQSRLALAALRNPRRNGERRAWGSPESSWRAASSAPCVGSGWRCNAAVNGPRACRETHL